jgi:hypothetical protein
MNLLWSLGVRVDEDEGLEVSSASPLDGHGVDLRFVQQSTPPPTDEGVGHVPQEVGDLRPDEKEVAVVVVVTVDSHVHFLVGPNGDVDILSDLVARPELHQHTGTRCHCCRNGGTQAQHEPELFLTVIYTL